MASKRRNMFQKNKTQETTENVVFLDVHRYFLFAPNLFSFMQGFKDEHIDLTRAQEICLPIQKSSPKNSVSHESSCQTSLKEHEDYGQFNSLILSRETEQESLLKLGKKSPVVEYLESFGLSFLKPSDQKPVHITKHTTNRGTHDVSKNTTDSNSEVSKNRLKGHLYRNLLKTLPIHRLLEYADFQLEFDGFPLNPLQTKLLTPQEQLAAVNSYSNDSCAVMPSSDFYKATKDKFQQLIAEGVCRLSSSPWTSSVYMTDTSGDERMKTSSGAETSGRKEVKSPERKKTSCAGAVGTNKGEEV
ncbi:hypothetical protein AAG570_002118 [Ranatra chinensis]|uniref:DEUBAD domain-containing protein n=1 Tax=Ranatra chinensis TaxID=642074 RepID=A0ABD0Y6M0_9HEMI